MINKAFEQIKESGSLKLFKSLNAKYKDGEQMRDFIYIKDAVDMTLFFDSVTGAGKDSTVIYNIGSGTANTWLTAANAIFKALGKEPGLEFIDMPENLVNQYQYYSKANLTKLRNEGYKRECMAIEESVRDYVKNYLMPNKQLTIDNKAIR
jgi:ADP-L-glycero-D-manno-heptose 6-epimerase